MISSHVRQCYCRISLPKTSRPLHSLGSYQYCPRYVKHFRFGNFGKLRGFKLPLAAVLPGLATAVVTISSMSFGKLNILQHKSWNVWNRDNIEKVLKDERELAEKEEVKRKQLMSVESERSTEALRSRRKPTEAAGDEFCTPPENLVGAGESGVANDKQLVVSRSAHKGYDLFEGIASKAASVQGNESATSSGTNREHETEKRKEKEREDRKWGLVALGQDSFTGESDAQKPWYVGAHKMQILNLSACSREF